MADTVRGFLRLNQVPLTSLARIASVAAGVQFGWGLQLSLLTPYVQELGIPHTWASFIWLCGPITGMFVQPFVGYYSDHCESPLGRRRPFILAGTCLVVCAVLLISFAAELGYVLGDSLSSRPRAITFFVLGFWILDLANNTLQGPCRALLADFTGRNQRRTRRANAFFSLFMAVGNVLGFATGSVNSWYKIFPFTRSRACDVSCANLKSAFLIDIVVLIITVIFSTTAAHEIPWTPTGSQQYAAVTPTTPLLPDRPANGLDRELNKSTKKDDDEEEEDQPEEEEGQAFFWELLNAFRDLPRPMWYILLVTALTWIAWFPFILFDTDWMGRDVYRGSPTTEKADASSMLYNKGVRMGSFGLVLQSIVLGVTSLSIEYLCRKLGTNYVWAISNFILTAGLACTAVVSSAALHHPAGDLPKGVLAGALLIFAVLGAPLAVTYSVPYALTATSTSRTGGGQGLSMGVLNLAVVVPQVIISLGSGPWDALFGGGNLPAFLLGSSSALIGGILALIFLPRPTPEFRSRGIRRTTSSPIP